ncbi:similar to Saccharomyces cerevisiae YJL002C OST1 Alpha subunit of the oligosaccharyltransferase complex of the ER lumen [Maudiozyma barnettii]|uniref:Dolichyl-diphosphooligosaccharide--protein glycosyltransferase subunit 1 n=1 Tax=Maudiozyma barnettii TaxID=61262 RepID=A0A8H2ZF97_9SACH|nr:dolichyl-diphosphooligosaccharide--protein glycotransferase subunit OST1 [Kazachstania barnettii]CAB4252115.1 similar to Saccharomyces cerevisiae YJL002C OST1 Alpha subunit of the oligosaccharyltransferase complex of the ER lumen [Kazachstania barnettii]CAD1778647.1 similar to Saccharomyces cerevisiae YJL002C OST1 Alpha subunit of the oligosaccharyltransferase complex of the ER lumen [Kazachstania barnettii]
MLFAHYWFLTAIVLLFKSVVSEEFVPPNSWENKEFKKTIEISNSFTAENLELTIVNIDSEPVTQYFVPIPSDIVPMISMFTAAYMSEEAFIQCMIVPGVHQLDDGTEISYGVIQFESPVAPGEEIALLAKIHYALNGNPSPEEIGMDDTQSLALTVNRYPISPYVSKTSSVDISGAEDFMELTPADNDNEVGILLTNQFKYGPFHEVPAFKSSWANVSYPVDYPLITVTDLKRDIWVSHWAHTAEFQEYYEIVNEGARLKNGFNRVEFMKRVQRTEGKGGNFIGVLGLSLTENSTDAYVTDKVGKVSSVMREEDKLLVKPRFPVFGGWAYNFTVGWTNTLDDFLHISGTEQDSFIISLPVLNGPPDTIYRNAEVSVILPEGAEVLDVGSPLPFSNATVTREYSYFDLADGHAKLTFYYSNLISELGTGELVVKYRFNTSSLYQKALYISYYVFGGLMTFFVLVNLNLNIK